MLRLVAQKVAPIMYAKKFIESLGTVVLLKPTKLGYKYTLLFRKIVVKNFSPLQFKI